MSSTIMHFGPEWMRAKHSIPSRPSLQPSSSPPPGAAAAAAAASAPAPPNGTHTTSPTTPATPGTSSYSALLTSQSPHAHHKRDLAYPFKYSREELLHIWLSGAARGSLPIEVERWPGIVREVPGEPVNFAELTDTEKKLYASSSINSEARRRPSADFAPQGTRLGPGHVGTQHGAGNNPTGAGGFGNRRRRVDSSGTPDAIAPSLPPRKQSWSGTPGLHSPSSTTPRTRLSSGSGFDGVLSGGESGWGGAAKRRGQGQGSRLDGVAETEASTIDAQAEVDAEAETGTDEQRLAKTEEASHKARTGKANEKQRSAPEIQAAVTEAAAGATDVDTLPNEVGKLALNGTNGTSTQVCDHPDFGTQQQEILQQLQQPQDVASFSKVLWSYVDPSGQIQGPFDGEKMQLWHDQHYFTDSLLMKRTHIDSEFLPLAEIRRRAQGERIFLSPLTDVLAPPGLSRMIPMTGHNPLLHRLATVDSPRQPSPHVHGVSSAHEAFLNAHSASSSSPSSSFGSSFARHSGSPDPLILGGRLPNHRFANELPLNGRLSADSFSSHGSPAMHHAIRHAYIDGAQQSRSSSFDAQDPNASNLDWQTRQGGSGQAWHTPEHARLGQLKEVEHPGLAVSGHFPFVNEAQYVAHGAPADPFAIPSNHGYYKPQERADYVPPDARQDEHALGDGSLSEGQREFATIPQQVTITPITTRLMHDGSRQGSAAPSPTVARIGSQLQAKQTPPLSPWGRPQQDEQLQHAQPVEALDHPTSSNIGVLGSPATPQRMARSNAQSEMQEAGLSDPWLSHHQDDASDGWPRLAEEPQRLTVANVTQHNGILAEQQNEAQPATGDVAPVTQPAESAEVAFATEPVASIRQFARAEKVNARVKATSKRKDGAVDDSSTQKAAAEQPHTTPPTSAPAPTTATKPAAAAAQKLAWTLDSDSKQEKAPTSLREIQEAEKKKQEARKERERTVRTAPAAAASSSANDEVQYVASWGLPTSQAVPRNNVPNAAKETAAASATPSVPVWTKNAAKPAAKAMKEIQEEEERRKVQVVKERETIASAAKRPAPVPATKGPSPPTLGTSAGGAWTIIGPNGKPSAPASVTGRSVTSQAPSVVSSKPGATVASTPRSASSSQPAKPAQSAAKPEEETDGPSLEFVGWLRDALQKGLNRSVQFEEIAQMLLQFPLDPDQLTIDIIAETIYGASTTLDGRRFAAEFVSKRKADARSTGSGGGVRSLADVVKAQPSKSNNDFGAFKVVTKKKRH